MRFLIAILAFVALTAPATSVARQHYRYSYGQVGSSQYYTARSGHRVHRPVQAARAPAGASAQCRDGSWSFSESHRGTCSWHGGVARWL
jgi:hypothetical protein